MICAVKNFTNTQGLAWFGKSDWDKILMTIVLNTDLVFFSFQRASSVVASWDAPPLWENKALVCQRY